MNRAVICGILFGVIMVGSLFSLLTVKHSTEEFKSRIDMITEACETGDMRAAAREIAELEDRWRQERKKLSVVVPSDQLTEISCAVAKLGYLCSHSCEDLTAECGSLRRRVASVLDSQMPHLFSIF